MTYKECVEKYLIQKREGDPIYTYEIAELLTTNFGMDKKKAAAAAAVTMKRIYEDDAIDDLRCYQKGIYYRTVNTPFGDMNINKEKVIEHKYLIDDKGYETGQWLLHYMGLTTQMPAKRVIATNSAKDCIRYDKKLDVSICPPKEPINTDNKMYLQTLDAIELLDKSLVDTEDPYMLIADHIKKHNLQYEKLLYYADKYYTRKTILHLAHTAGLR